MKFSGQLRGPCPLSEVLGPLREAIGPSLKSLLRNQSLQACPSFLIQVTFGLCLEQRTTVIMHASHPFLPGPTLRQTLGLGLTK